MRPFMPSPSLFITYLLSLLFPESKAQKKSGVILAFKSFLFPSCLVLSFLITISVQFAEPLLFCFQTSILTTLLFLDAYLN